MNINLEDLCKDLIEYFEINDISKVTVYYHWVVGEFVLEYNDSFMGYCSCVYEKATIAKKRNKM